MLGRCLIALGVVSLAAAPQERPTFSARADLVVVHATVEDRRGRAVPGLELQQFLVYEDDRPQPLSVFSATDAPATIGLLIDNSTSMFPGRDRVIAAAVEFTELSNREDEVFVLAFNEDVRVVWPLQRLDERNPATLRSALTTQISARGKTAFYDAIIAGLARLSSGTHTRQVLVVVSDGGDNASRQSADDMLRAIRSSNAMIYAVALDDPVDHDGNTRLLRRVASDTGGEVFTPNSIDAVQDALAHIAQDIRAAYTLGYVPANQARDGALRRLRVVARHPDGRRLNVRSRTMYQAPSSGGAQQP